MPLTAPVSGQQSLVATVPGQGGGHTCVIISSKLHGSTRMTLPHTRDIPTSEALTQEPPFAISLSKHLSRCLKGDVLALMDVE